MVLLKNSLTCRQTASLQKRKKIELSKAALPPPQGGLGCGEPLSQGADNTDACNANGTKRTTDQDILARVCS